MISLLSFLHYTTTMILQLPLLFSSYSLSDIISHTTSLPCCVMICNCAMICKDKGDRSILVNHPSSFCMSTSHLLPYDKPLLINQTTKSYQPSLHSLFSLLQPMLSLSPINEIINIHSFIQSMTKSIDRSLLLQLTPYQTNTTTQSPPSNQITHPLYVISSLRSSSPSPSSLHKPRTKNQQTLVKHIFYPSYLCYESLHITSSQVKPTSQM